MSAGVALGIEDESRVRHPGADQVVRDLLHEIARLITSPFGDLALPPTVARSTEECHLNLLSCWAYRRKPACVPCVPCSLTTPGRYTGQEGGITGMLC